MVVLVLPLAKLGVGCDRESGTERRCGVDPEAARSRIITSASGVDATRNARQVVGQRRTIVRRLQQRWWRVLRGSIANIASVLDSKCCRHRGIGCS